MRAGCFDLTSTARVASSITAAWCMAEWLRSLDNDNNNNSNPQPEPWACEAVLPLCCVRAKIQCFFFLRFCCCCCCVLWLDFLFNALPQCYWVCRWKRNCAYRWANRKQATKMGLFVAWTSLALMGPPVKEKKTPFDLFPFPATITYLYVCSMFILYMYILSVIYLQAMRSSQQKCSCQLRVRARTNTRSVSSHPTPKQRILYLPRNSFSTRTIRHWG